MDRIKLDQILALLSPAIGSTEDESVYSPCRCFFYRDTDRLARQGPDIEGSSSLVDRTMGDFGRGFCTVTTRLADVDAFVDYAGGGYGSCRDRFGRDGTQGVCRCEWTCQGTGSVETDQSA
jgi:hypothetical protein